MIMSIFTVVIKKKSTLTEKANGNRKAVFNLEKVEPMHTLFFKHSFQPLFFDYAKESLIKENDFMHNTT